MRRLIGKSWIRLCNCKAVLALESGLAATEDDTATSLSIMSDLKSRLEKLKKSISIGEKRKKIREIEAESARPGFWDDHVTAGKKMKELSDLQKEIEEIEEIELYLEEGEKEMAEEALNKLEFKTFLSGPHDKSGAILAIHAGQGGTEAMDWAEMLKRMYARYCEKKDWRVELVDETPGEEAGIKSCVMEVEGEYTYGYLKGEKGAHRLVRQSPFNADNLRQTSFAKVEVSPIIDESIHIDIKPEDIEFEAFRASGHGGQNVNKVSTAVRLKHLPTNTVVTCQTERFQARNREIAMKILRSKLYEMEQQRLERKMEKLKGKHKTPGWGNQIRSYVLHPYKMVKDHRTGFESPTPDEVLDGDLDGFIDAELRAGIR